jgi:hypothetical protein
MGFITLLEPDLELIDDDSEWTKSGSDGLEVSKSEIDVATAAACHSARD